MPASSDAGKSIAARTNEDPQPSFGALVRAAIRAMKCACGDPVVSTLALFQFQAGQGVLALLLLVAEVYVLAAGALVKIAV
mmetsp:Transcript_96858/g.186756  ORF Transcript_96858/g.186756 Transcript_96858/m.186756 type:complete len:81 (-) Transcript_96858:355-597(-)